MGLLRLVGKGSECHCYHTIFVRLGDGAAIFPLRNGHSFSRLWVLELLRKMGGEEGLNPADSFNLQTG